MFGFSIHHLATTDEPIVVSNDTPILRVVTNPITTKKKPKELTLEELRNKIISCKASNRELKAYFDNIPRDVQKKYVPYVLRDD